MRLAPFAAALVLALPGPAAAGPGVHQVRIAQMAFAKPPPDLHVGDIIEWVNADIVPHTATARDGGFDVTLKPNASARVTLRRAGAVQVYCRFHPTMTTTLKVLPASAAARR